ncbi:Protein FAR-RED IMPAIRED RESPONSE 1, partial [Bienertia sinuspersici]
YAKQQGFGIVKAGGAYKQEKGKTLNERRNCTWKCKSGGKPDARIRASSRVLNGVSGKGVKMANRKTKKVGCPTHSALAAERNGVENFPVSERQLRNVFDKEERLKMMKGDANAMAAYFHRMSTDNHNFFHLNRLDDDERLKDVMWVDARSRAAYIEFGDVIDQDAAMKKAIAKVMPNTRHRWCLWHILNKLPLKLGGYDKYDEIKQALLRLYQEREWWIPPYMKDMFWAGMRSTQRVESMNSFFDKYLKKQTRLYEFVQQYCKAMERRFEDEKDPNTRKDILTRRKREYEVKYNSNGYETWCVCKLMESSGIICRHIIAVFEKNDVEEYETTTVDDKYLYSTTPYSTAPSYMFASSIVSFPFSDLPSRYKVTLSPVSSFVCPHAMHKAAIVVDLFK